MIKIINLTLYKNEKIVNIYNDIKSLYNDNTHIFNIENAKTTLSNNIFKRETNEYSFILDIINKEATYFLKDKNMTFNVDVEKVLYSEEKNNIILEYKISSDEETFKILIESSDNNE